MHFSELPDNAKVWIYLSSRELEAGEVENVLNKGKEFAAGLASHGNPVHAAFEVFYNRFLVFFAETGNENISGCTVDNTIHFIKQIEEEYELTLLNRKLIAYRENGRILVKDIDTFTSELTPEKTDKIVLFDTLVNFKADILKNFEVPLRNSWLGKSLNLHIHEPV